MASETGAVLSRSQQATAGFPIQLLRETREKCHASRKFRVVKYKLDAIRPKRKITFQSKVKEKSNATDQHLA